MSTLREIKTHIQSVSNISKVTNALGVVSAAKTHRLQMRASSTRAFAEKSWQVLNHLAASAEASLRENPLFCGHAPIRRTAILLVTSNRGMAGAYDQNAISMALRRIDAAMAQVETITVGRVGRDEMLRRGTPIHADFSHLDDKLDIEAITPVARVILDGFRKRVFDECVMVYTRFAEGAKLKAVARELLPICANPIERPRDYIYEPSPDKMVERLLAQILRFQIYAALLESLAAENTSRAVAMRTATHNANDLVGDLQIRYNKVRQQAITAELLDILGGSSAQSHR